jgi:proline dehydrogenase
MSLLLPNKLIQRCGDRYVAGYSLEQGLNVISALVERGYYASFDILGEDASSVEHANRTMLSYCKAIGQIAHKFEFGNHPKEKPVSVSIKPSGICYVSQEEIFDSQTEKKKEIPFDKDTPLDQRLTYISSVANERNIDLTLDMEDHRYTDQSLAAVRSVWAQGYHNLGLVLQSALDRTAWDINDLSDDVTNNIAPPVFRARTCRGIYIEPKKIAAGRKEAKERLISDIEHLLNIGAYVEIATHDAKLIRTLQEDVLHGISKDRYEFQFLLGVPVAENVLAPRLKEEGHVVRFYTPVQLVEGEGIKYMRRRLSENWLMLLQGATTIGRKSLAKEIRKKLFQLFEIKNLRKI